MRKFYKNAEAVAIDGGFAVELDGKRLKTPAGRPWILPNEKLARAIAAEWHAQSETVIPATMPLMQLAATAYDHVPEARKDMIVRLLPYMESELVCLRAEHPETLVRLQESLWQPPLDWFNQRYDIHIEACRGLGAVDVPAGGHERMHNVLDSLDNLELIGVQTATLGAGSLVLGLALYEKKMTAAEVFAAAELESTYQIEIWGGDKELTARRESVRTELASTAEWFELIKSA
jgi:chaperone required for assembly of F1-ATPase